MKLGFSFWLWAFAMAGFAGWVAWRLLRRSDSPLGLIIKWIISAVLGGFVLASVLAGPFAPIFAAVGGILLGIVWAPTLGAMLAKPLTSLYTGTDEEADPRPFYSIAIARQKQGKYAEAVEEVEKQLTKFPEDFTGLMLLAEIQAESLNDFPSAWATVQAILSQTGHTPKNIAFALNRVADWHLKFAQDPEGARSALDRIAQLLPGTEEAQIAQQRIAHMASKELLREQAKPSRIQLGAFDAHIGLRTEPSAKQAEIDPAQAAAEYVKHLERYPLDNEVREKLALVYANHYQRLDLASGELEQLIAAPNQLPNQVVHWLNLLADLQVKLVNNHALARQTLERIVQGFPKSAAADKALSRIAYLNLQLKGQQEVTAVKMGAYEQNIGLR